MGKPTGSALVFAILSLIICSGCSQNRPVADWRLVVKNNTADVYADSEYIYASASGESKSERMALDAARHGARLKIAQALESQISLFLEDTEFSAEIPEKVYSEYVLKSSRVQKQKVEKHRDTYQANVLIKMPVQEANAAL